jgi:hypothetical protein
LEFAINPIAINLKKTIMHELGHIVLGNTMPSQHSEYANHRGPKEFEAEGTAHLVMNELELMDEETASYSRGYVRHWLQNELPPEQTIRRVFRAAEVNLKAGRIAPILPAKPTNFRDGRRQTATKKESRDAMNFRTPRPLTYGALAHGKPRRCNGSGKAYEALAHSPFPCLARVREWLSRTPAPSQTQYCLPVPWSIVPMGKGRNVLGTGALRLSRVALEVTLARR